jgi:hypothetical protein
VPVTAVIRGDGRALSNADQREATHYYLPTTSPDHAFDTKRHQIHPMDHRALAVVTTAIAHRSPVGVLRGNAATKPGATTALGALLLPPDKPLTVADFGRTQFAAVLAATTAFAATATRMAPKPRYNFQFLLNDLTSSLEIKDDDVPTFRPRWRLLLARTENHSN